MATCVVDYTYGCSTNTYVSTRTGVVYVPYVLLSMPDIRSTNLVGHGASPSPLSSFLRRMSRAHLNSSYISTLLKVEVSGSCIIVFLDVIVFPLL